jgi:spore coat protein U-like protein
MVDRNSTISVLSQVRTNSFRERQDLRQPTVTLSRILSALISFWLISAPAHAATVTATVNATPVKPLLIAKLQDLDLGTVTLGPGVWSNATVSISMAGTFSCPSANVVCSGATKVAQYNVQGSNKQTVFISAPNVTLVNQSDSTKTLTLVTDAPASVVLTSSGIPGVDFSVGGSVTLDSSTESGTYVGTFNVTVDY